MKIYVIIILKIVSYVEFFSWYAYNEIFQNELILMNILVTKRRRQ